MEENQKIITVHGANGGTVYVTQETYDALGAKGVQALADQAKYPTVIVSYQDMLNKDGTEPDIKTPEGLKIAEDRVKNLIDKAFKDRPDLRAQYTPEKIREITPNALDKTNSFGFAISAKDGDPTQAGFIAAGDLSLSKTKTDLAVEISGIPGKFLKDIPGNDRDWQLFMQMHEMGHVNDSYQEPFHIINGKKDFYVPIADKLGLETFADNSAIAAWPKAYEKGVVSDPRVPHVFMGMRALGTFLNAAFPDHATSAPVQEPGEGKPPSTDPAKNWESVEAARLKIGAEIANNPQLAAMLGIKPISNLDRALTLENTLRQRCNLSEQASHEIIKSIRDGQASVDEILEKYIPDPIERKKVRAEFDKTLKAEHERKAYEAAVYGGQPGHAAIFKAVRDLNARGAFAGDPIQQQYVNEFLAAADKYVDKSYWQLSPPQPAAGPEQHVGTRPPKNLNGLKMETAANVPSEAPGTQKSPEVKTADGKKANRLPGPSAGMFA